MSQLVRMLDFTVLSVLQEKLPPEALILLIQSAGSWSLEDVEDIFPPEDKLYKEYLKAYLRVANSRSKLRSSRSKKFARHKLPTSYRSKLVRRYQTFPLPPPIIRTSHPDAPGPFITIPPLIPEGFLPVLPLLIPPLPIPPELRQIDESVLLLKKKFRFYSIPDRPKKKAEVSQGDTISKSNSYISISSCFNNNKNYSALPHSTTTAPFASSSSTSIPTPLPTDTISNEIAPTCYSEISGYHSLPTYTIATTKAPGLYSTSFPTPPLTDYTGNVVASTCYSETSGYNPYPSYTIAAIITPAFSDPAPFPIPSPTDYTSNGTASTYYSEASEYYSHLPYNPPTTVASTSIPTPSPIDYIANLVASTCYPKNSLYSYPYAVATTFSTKQSK